MVVCIHLFVYICIQNIEGIQIVVRIKKERSGEIEKTGGGRCEGKRVLKRMWSIH